MDKYMHAIKECSAWVMLYFYRKGHLTLVIMPTRTQSEVSFMLSTTT